uniref:Xylulose kinase-1 n=1 Tax=Tanacetum cinerariifolium TaxID=118510 RepID=A0A699KJL6_TANCI|nr:hypothetical protein [Tanacetum cinerariifolium]
MVAYLSKSDASKLFNQITGFLNRSSIKYALTVNPNIYVSCIKRFWTTVAVKQVNDVTRLQALVDKNKVVVTEATRSQMKKFLQSWLEWDTRSHPQSLHFTKLSSQASGNRKFNFSKYIFDSLVRNVDSPTKFYMYPRFLQLMIRKQVGNLSTNTTKYTSPALTQKVFENIRRVGKGFFRVETPLFEGMLVDQQVAEEGDADENDETVNVVDAAEGDVSAAHGEVPTIVEEPSIPSPTPPTLPPQPSQDIPSTFQVQQTPPQSSQVQPPSPQPQPKPQQAAKFPMNLIQEVIDTCNALTRRVENLEFDKVAQALEITKLKRRIKKLERRNKVRKLKLRRLQRVETLQRVEISDEIMLDDVSNQGRMIAEMDQDDAVVLKDDKEEDREVVDAIKDVEEAKFDESAQDQGRQAESQAEIYKIDMDHANKVLSMQEDETKPAEVQEVVDVVTTAKLITEVVTTASEPVSAASAIITTAEAQVPVVTLTAAPERVAATLIRKRKGVLISDPEEESTTSIIIPVEIKSKDKELQVELNKNIDWDEAIDHVKRKAKEDPTVKRYQMDYFKGMSYDDIRPIIKAKFNSNVAFLLKTKEQIEEDENEALQKLNETLVKRAAKRQKLDEEVEELKGHL